MDPKIKKNGKRRIGKKVQFSVPDFKVNLVHLPVEDPLLMSSTILQQIPNELKLVASENYHSFRTNYRHSSPLLGGNFNFRMPLGVDPINVEAIHDLITAIIKSFYPFGARLNLTFSLFLEDEEEENPNERYLFYYASSNNHQMFQTSQFITSFKDIEKVLDKITYETISDHLDLIRKSSKIRVLHISSVLINALVLSDALLIKE